MREGERVGATGAWEPMGGEKRSTVTAGRAPLSVIALVAALGGGGSGVEAQSGPVEIPLRLEAGRLTVSVTGPDGAEMRFALTTGSPTTVLTESTAGRTGPGAELVLGGISVPLDGAQTIPDTGLAGDDGTLDGMVGGNLLSGYDVLLDVPAGRLVLKPVGMSVSWPGMALSAPQRLRIYHGVVVGLDVTLDGRPFQAMLDLGTPEIVVNEGGRPEGMAADVGTTSLALEGVTLAGQPLRVRDLPIFERWDPEGRGFVLVGASIAYECAIALSWAHAEIRTCVR